MRTDERPAWNLLTGTLTQYVLLGVNVLLGIFLMPLTMRHFGQADYGLWMLAASMTAYFQLLDLGYGSGLVRQITHADARRDEEEINTLLSTFVVVYSGIALIALAATALLVAVVLRRFPNLTPPQVQTGQWILAILGARIAIGFPMSVFGAITTSRQRFAASGAIAIALALLQGAATYAIVKAGRGVVTLVAVTTMLGIASYGAYAILALRTFPAMRLSLARFSGRRVREVTGFSLYLLLIGIAFQVGSSAVNMIIGAYIGISAIAVYTVATRLAEYQRQLCGQFSGLLFPLVVRFHASQDAGALRTTLLEGTRIALAFVTISTLGLIAFGRDLVALWMGPGFDESVLPLYILASLGIVMVAQGPTGMILLGTGRHRLVAWASIAEVTSNVALSIALSGPFGLAGVAMGTAVPYALINLLVLVPIACRTVGLSLRVLLKATSTPALAGAIPAALAALALRAAMPVGSAGALLMQASLVGIVYGAAIWTVGLTSEDRARYRASARELAGGILTAPPFVTP